MINPRDDLRKEVNLGQEICQRIKNIYYPNEKWQRVYKKVGEEFSKAKKQARIFFPDLDIFKLLMEMRKWSHDDLKDSIEA